MSTAKRLELKEGDLVRIGKPLYAPVPHYISGRLDYGMVQMGVDLLNTALVEVLDIGNKRTVVRFLEGYPNDESSFSIGQTHRLPFGYSGFIPGTVKRK